MQKLEILECNQFYSQLGELFFFEKKDAVLIPIHLSDGVKVLKKK
jgi:hypothetical protein